jgi:catechol 2,3-dioxygenase-like lactoylglutathione lyase family enzyme
VNGVESAAQFESVAPVIRVRDLRAATDRYRRLGFQVERYAGPARYGFVSRGAVSMHLTEWGQYDPGQDVAAIVYLYVSDADAVHAEWSRADVPGQLEEPTDREYGLREFSYIDPDGTLHRVGSPLRRSSE